MAGVLEEVAAHRGDADNPPDIDADRYRIRVVGNLSRILAREAELGSVANVETSADLELLLGVAGSLEAQVEALDDLLAHRPDALDRRAVFELLTRDVDRRLQIARPGYGRPQ